MILARLVALCLLTAIMSLAVWMIVKAVQPHPIAPPRETPWPASVATLTPIPPPVGHDRV